MKTYWIVLSDCTSFKKHWAFFYKKRGPLIQGYKIQCPRLEHLLNFTLRYGYSLWYDVIFVDNINVLDLALWAEQILRLIVFLCNLKKCIHCGQLILRKISKIGATRCQILRLKCTQFDFRWGSAPDPSGGAYSAPLDPLAVLRGPTSKGEQQTKIRLYNALVISVLLYGSETCTLLKADERRLEAFHMNCQRRILGIRGSILLRTPQSLAKLAKKA